MLAHSLRYCVLCPRQHHFPAAKSACANATDGCFTRQPCILPPTSTWSVSPQGGAKHVDVPATCHASLQKRSRSAPTRWTTKTPIPTTSSLHLQLHDGGRAGFRIVIERCLRAVLHVENQNVCRDSLLAASNLIHSILFPEAACRSNKRSIRASAVKLHVFESASPKQLLKQLSVSLPDSTNGSLHLKQVFRVLMASLAGA